VTKVINFYGGPGSGKSTQASGLFYKMKALGYSVELVNEFAKECVWEGNVPMLKDQLWVLAHQHRKLVRLRDKVDYIITDSPVLLSIVYRNVYDGPMYTDVMDKLALECYHLYDNINVVLKRTDQFDDVGRAQDRAHSEKIDSDILTVLHDAGCDYRSLRVNDSTVDNIIRTL
jgi:ABC-type phosphate transport system ATPase subunit|tara:strand:+ start:166 stop:684 length:519 start_codon:yes stop_codon:yes gene_type:complete